MKAQKEAERRLTIVCRVAELMSQGIDKAGAIGEVSETHGVDRATLYRWHARIDGKPRADWLPLLAPDYKGTGPKPADCSEDAWRFFLSYVEKASARSPLTKAFRETAEMATLEGWQWPSWPTVWRRWRDLDAGTKALIRSGPKAFDKTIPAQQRSVAHLGAMEIVNLDGRMADVFVEWEVRTIGRPITINIQDVYSRKMLGWRISKTEDSDTTKAVMLDVIDSYGQFDALRTDNGRAFTSHKIAGGAKHRFRRKKSLLESTGILAALSIELGFALPGRGGSKPIERGYRDVATDIDTNPEFKLGYCGHKPDAKPEDFKGGAVPIATFRRVYDRELHAHNAREGRRTEMTNGKLSFDQVFAESYAKRPRRMLTAAQRRFCMLDGVVLKPNKDTGALVSNGFRYWAQEHQNTLLKHRNSGVLVMFDPRDRSLPVMVLDRDGRMIVDSLACEAKGKFNSSEDGRQFNRGKAQLKKARSKEIKAINLMTDAELNNQRKRMHDARPTPEPPAGDATVIEPVFGLPGGAVPNRDGAVIPGTFECKAATATIDRELEDKFADHMARPEDVFLRKAI